ncbi:pentatricopeptide repeat-containing protein At3g04130, mitochondrial [Prosopis cineraria]|uniref:pentatricopeptide repeat-containing protein At3g04130, mitochondrial n=1 Tax=Prosopis cineraria TaxID=364024 RepID=UPI00241038E6|nr:pentatricopeptide repeat-containing protein At3g04130, mitochondrial [Prosopis cineraria]XP_054809815.1 pentatricopeptide repeat-containing protein At3g04130, mitochondrial [Prosopis cineraria]XP_054809822.1 pentatricopeptide repeat-containing protein At3g04130, mitochondrial [Prosopis cineraria]XP_054809829.1 pentatricopeptide repeat-containing protein At3g04130, mitochondrial [Prosopis cineraria]XP_054809837.1 pentatricopeptide repeat-containing protein At3g04130, mitochondrial [Prosopis c
MQAACARPLSCMCCQSLTLRNLCSPSTSSRLVATRNFQHREQCQGHTGLFDLDILISKASKGSSEDEIFQSLVNDRACDAINVSHNLIEGLLHRFKDNWKSAFGIFKWASLHSGFRHSPETYDMMVDILGKMKQWGKVRALLEEMSQRSLITLNTIAKVMRRFAGGGQWKDAVRIFDEIETLGLDKNIESLNLLFDTLCKENKVEQARAVFLNLKQHISPNAYTFNIFIHGWCKVRRVDEAHWTILEMKGHGFRPSVISYTTIIQCYCREQNFNRVYELLDEMQAQDCSPNVITFTGIIFALAKAENFEEALQMAERMKSVGCKPDTLFYNSLIYTLGRAGRVHDAIYVFKVEMQNASLTPNTCTYNTMISMFCDHAEQSKAFELLKEMQDSGLCKPDTQSYHPLIKSCFKAGVIDSCLNDILDYMVNKHRLCLDISTYTLIIHGLCRADQCEWAYSIFEEMINHGLVPRHRTCRLLLDEVKLKNMYGAAEKIEDVMKKLL